MKKELGVHTLSEKPVYFILEPFHKIPSFTVFGVFKATTGVREAHLYPASIIFVLRLSWKKHERIMENHGKIMEFDSRKPLGTLLLA